MTAAQQKSRASSLFFFLKTFDKATALTKLESQNMTLLKFPCLRYSGDYDSAYSQLPGALAQTPQGKQNASVA